MSKGRGPLLIITGCRFGGIALLAVGAVVIEHPDGIGFEFDDGLLNRVVDTFAVAGRNLDSAIVVARRQLALHENVSAFYEPLRQLLKAFAEDHTLCHWVFSFHSLFSSFQDFLVATENFVTAVPFARYLVSALRPINPMIES